MGCSERIALKQLYYQGWNRSPAQAGCMRQVLGAGALGRPRGMGWRGRRELGSGWGTHVNPWLIHVNVWQNPLQCCKVISLQLIKNKWKKKKRNGGVTTSHYFLSSSSSLHSFSKWVYNSYFRSLGDVVKNTLTKAVWWRRAGQHNDVTEMSVW